MEQVVILVIIGLISFVNWLIQRSADLRKRHKLEKLREEEESFKEQESSPTPTNPAMDMRKLMEALGLPMEDEGEQPVPERFIQLRSTPQPPPLPAFEPPPPIIRPVQPVAPIAPQIHVSPATPTTKWKKILASRDGVRQAIVLREILGPPKAFTL